jgi:hypothetical protein
MYEIRLVYLFLYVWAITGADQATQGAVLQVADDRAAYFPGNFLLQMMIKFFCC